MATVQGIRERLQLPLYDCLAVDPEEQLRDAEPSSTLKFFVNVQKKTKLLTNMQSASLLPHYNTFEARALRIVVSDLPPAFPDKIEVTADDLEITTDDDPPKAVNTKGTTAAGTQALVSLTLTLAEVVDYIREANDSDTGDTFISLDDVDFDISNIDSTVSNSDFEDKGYGVTVTDADLQGFLEDQLKDFEIPLDEQVIPDNGSGSVISKLIFNSVTSLYVGEKLMIQMPTWYFPAGGGPYSPQGHFVSNGTTSPQDTFRFAEAIQIDKGQNFRVEIEVPDADVLKDLQRIYGPLFVWVVLDGYMTRDVQ